MDPRRELNQLEDDIRATSEDVVADAERLLAIEKRKVSMDPGDPNRVRLAKQADDLGDNIAAKVQVQLRLVTEAGDAA